MNTLKYDELKQKQAILREQMLTEAKRFFAEESKALFEDHPKLESFSWTQYTPYFNDGDECTFSAHIDYPHINGEDSWEVRNDPELAKATREVKKFLSCVEEDNYKSCFGDHVKVTISRNGGTSIEDYEHEHD